MGNNRVGFAGLCTNESCPYRHVNVNPKAPICEGFLQGYCADGDMVKARTFSLVVFLDYLSYSLPLQTL